MLRNIRHTDQAIDSDGGFSQMSLNFQIKKLNLIFYVLIFYIPYLMCNPNWTPKINLLFWGLISEKLPDQKTHWVQKPKTWKRRDQKKKFAGRDNHYWDPWTQSHSLITGPSTTFRSPKLPRTRKTFHTWKPVSFISLKASQTMLGIIQILSFCREKAFLS